MNRINGSNMEAVISALVEGVSVNATCRMTGVAKHTVLNLLRTLGCAAAAYHHRHVRDLRVRRLQCDEIWQFVGAKRKNVTPEQAQAGWGDSWTWTAIDADTKLCVTYYVGDRGGAAAYEFMQDCAERIIGRPQITTDAHRPYLQAVEDAFGADCDYAQLHKIWRFQRAGAPLQSRNVHRLRHENCDWRPRSEARQHVFCGAPESHDEDVYAALHAADQRVFKKVGESRTRSCVVFPALQLLPRTQDASCHACNGSGPNRSRLEHRRNYAHGRSIYAEARQERPLQEKKFKLRYR
jgi:IS1 family transposase